MRTAYRMLRTAWGIAVDLTAEASLHPTARARASLRRRRYGRAPARPWPAPPWRPGTLKWLEEDFAPQSAPRSRRITRRNSAIAASFPASSSA